MQILPTLLIGFLATAIVLPELTFAEETPAASTGAELCELVVSHTDEMGILQLYRMKEDGSGRRQLTHSKRGCRMPACSPDGRKLVYLQEADHGLSLWISDVDGKNARAVVDEGMNLIPSWLPDSRHIVWMKALPGQDPSRKSQIHLMNTETGESRRLFSDPEQLKFSNSMPAISPMGDLIAFVSDRSGDMRPDNSGASGGPPSVSSSLRVEGISATCRPPRHSMPQFNPKISIYWLILVLFGGISMLPLVMSHKYGYISPGKVYLRALRNDPFFDDAARILTHCAICVAVAAIVALFGYHEEPPLRFSTGMLMLWIGLLAAVLGFLRSRGASWELYVCVASCVVGRIIAAIPRWLVRTPSTPSSAIGEPRK